MMADFDTIGPGVGGAAGDPLDISSSGPGAVSPGTASSGLGGASGWTAGFGLAGLGLAAYGQIQQSKDESAIYQSKIQEAQLDEKIQGQHEQQMELVAKRSKIQNLRETQQKVAMGLAAEANQGAQFGSGAGGARGQILGAGAYNELGISQNLEIGRSIFSLNQQIDEQKIKQAGLESKANTAGGLAAFGGDIAKAAPALGQLATLALV